MLTGEKDTIDQHPVFVLKTDNKKLWVDPEKDFLPVKREDVIRGVVQRQIEISYVRDKTHGWIPSSWITTLFDQTGTTTWWQDTMTVTEFSINKPIDDSEFELSLPNGTVVKDYAPGEGHGVQANVTVNGSTSGSDGLTTQAQRSGPRGVGLQPDGDGRVRCSTWLGRCVPMLF